MLGLWTVLHNLWRGGKAEIDPLHPDGIPDPEARLLRRPAPDLQDEPRLSKGGIARAGVAAAGGDLLFQMDDGQVRGEPDQIERYPAVLHPERVEALPGKQEEHPFPRTHLVPEHVAKGPLLRSPGYFKMEAMTIGKDGRGAAWARSSSRQGLRLRSGEKREQKEGGEKM